MNADQVRALVQAKYPSAMKSPLAAMFAMAASGDESDRTIGFAKLQAVLCGAQMKRDAHDHAVDCVYACKSQDVGFDKETVSHNVECNFPGLSIEECDEIASAAIAATRSQS
jgi:hypothetical protein